MVEISHLTKRYGNFTAVDDLTLTIPKGEIIGFLGLNGAGKSTTMNVITGYISATEGYVKINGIDILEEPEEAKKHIGYLPEQPPLYLDMTVLEYLSFVYDLKKVKKEKEKHLDECMKLVKIEDVANRRIGNLSKGYRQRVGLAQALIGDPEVLILDEPTVGLDPKQILEIRDIIRDLGEKHTVILSSHIMQEISAVCERIAIINQGRLLLEDRLENLVGENNKNHILLEVYGSEERVKQAFSRVQGITFSAKEKDGITTLKVEPEQDVRVKIFDICAKENLPIRMMKPVARTLEEVFLEAIRQDMAEREEE